MKRSGRPGGLDDSVGLLSRERLCVHRMRSCFGVLVLGLSVGGLSSGGCAAGAGRGEDEAPAAGAELLQPVPAEPTAEVQEGDSPGLSAEAAMERLEELSRDATRESLEAFIAANPSVLTVKREPYGSALAWALEFAREDAALELLEAGANPCDPFLGDTGALALAARGGLVRFAKAYIDGGHACTTASYWGSPLHFAAQYGHVEVAKLLLASGADVDARAADFDTTPLIRAATAGKSEMIELLLSAGASIEARDSKGRTALHWAVFAARPREIHEWSEDGGPHSTYYVDSGRPLALEALLRAGADASARDNEQQTPLHHAGALNAVRAIAPLLRHGASKSAKDKNGKTPRDLAKRGEHTDAMKLL